MINPGFVVSAKLRLSSVLSTASPSHCHELDFRASRAIDSVQLEFDFDGNLGGLGLHPLFVSVLINHAS